MGDDEEFSKGYIKGYREGMLEAWNELVKLTSRGLNPRELQIMIKSSQPMLVEKVEARMAEIEKALGKNIFSEAQPIVVKPEAAMEMTPGQSVCFKEEKPEKGPGFVKSLTLGGAPMLSISRMHPDQIVLKFGLKGYMIWLTKSEQTAGMDESKMRFISPNNLPVLSEEIQQFLTTNAGGVVFLEGLEYLYSQNDFRSVLKFIQNVNEHVVLRKGFLVMSVNPSTMDPREFSLLEREMAQIS